MYAARLAVSGIQNESCVVYVSAQRLLLGDGVQIGTRCSYRRLGRPPNFVNWTCYPGTFVEGGKVESQLLRVVVLADNHLLDVV